MMYRIIDDTHKNGVGYEVQEIIRNEWTQCSYARGIPGVNTHQTQLAAMYFMMLHSKGCNIPTTKLSASLAGDIET